MNRPQWLEIAYQYNGLHEEKDAEALMAFFESAGFQWDPRGDQNAWCGAYVRACLVRAGLPDPGEDGLRASFYKTYGVEEKGKPRPGALVIGPNHVALLVEGNKIIGGNQGDMVKEGQVDWYFSNPVYRYPVVPVEPVLLADYSDEAIQAEYDRRFGVDPSPNGEDPTELEPEQSLPDGTITAGDLGNEILQQIVIPHNARESVMIPETGEMVKVQPFRLTDGSYQLPTKDEVLAAIEKTKVDEIQYVVEEWDCEDFARRFVSKMHEEGIKTAGRVMAWSGNHAFNIVAVQGDPVDFVFVEPQTDEIVVLYSEDKYNIENCLIIIS